MGERLWYKLDGKTPVPGSAAEAFQGNRSVASDEIGESHISTVFLGLDHRHYGDGLPLLFETMIFGGKHDGYMERCSTWEEAEVMHAKAVDLVKND